ncbi:hypothetical protein ACEPPN_019418 [Leptodophora sp. 'Broadleaf-Isolate-01']
MFCGCGMAFGLPKHLKKLADDGAEPRRPRIVSVVKEPRHDMGNRHDSVQDIHPIFRSASFQQDNTLRERKLESALLKQAKGAVEEVV